MSQPDQPPSAIMCVIQLLNAYTEGVPHLLQYVREQASHPDRAVHGPARKALGQYDRNMLRRT